MIEDTIPNNWKVVEWADVVTIINGKNQIDVVDDNGDFPIYGSGGVMGYSNKYLCKANCTIVGRKGTINNPIYVTRPFWNVDTAFGIEPHSEVNPKYLYYFCKSFNFKKLDNSTTIPSLAKTVLLSIKMPLAPKTEQDRIVAKLDELFSELDNGVEALKKAKEQLKVYRQAVLKEAFSKYTDITSIRKVTSLVTSGSRGWAKYYSENGAIFIRIGNLTRDRIFIDLTDVQFLKLPDKAEGVRSLLNEGDVLISITADLGSIGYVSNDISEAYINQHIALVRFLNTEQSKFMAWFLRSERGQKDLLKNKRGGGKLGLGLDDIRDAFVPVIRDEEALATVQEIESRLSVCDNIELIVDNSLIEVEKLKQSILKKAFEGKIV